MKLTPDVIGAGGGGDDENCPTLIDDLGPKLSGPDCWEVFIFLKTKITFLFPFFKKKCQKMIFSVQ